MDYFGAGSFNAAQDVDNQRQAISVSVATSIRKETTLPPRLQHALATVIAQHAAPADAHEAAQTLNDKSAASAAHVDEPYYTLDMLDSAAQPASDFSIAPALLAAVRTRLLLEFWIDKSGVVRKLQVIEPAETQDEVAAMIDSLRAVRFSPAIRDGMPVNSRKLVELAPDGAETLAAQ
jgi:hypothetical protein